MGVGAVAVDADVDGFLMLSLFEDFGSDRWMDPEGVNGTEWCRFEPVGKGI